MAIRRIAVAVAAATLAIVAGMQAPAAAAPLRGEVNNGSDWWIGISNCWDSNNGNWTEGDLSCNGVGWNVPYDENAKPAWRWLLPHTNSGYLNNWCAWEPQNKCWYDVDAIRVPNGCDIVIAGFWGESRLSAQEHAPRWYKITDGRVISVLRVEC